jgi:hypothetical protein
MLTMQRVIPLIFIIVLLVAACSGNAPPSLVAAGQPTLVFIYTNG